MLDRVPLVFAFGEYELDEALLELRHAGDACKLDPKRFVMLRFLIRNAHRVVSRDELLREVWPDVTVTSTSAKAAIHEIRGALGDSGTAQRFITTVKGGGYRFSAPLATRPATSAPSIGGSPPTRPAAPESDDVFVGREREMTLMRSALDGAARGERRIVLLEGPPGIGKTRTASELGREAAIRGFEVHVARTHEWDAEPPLWLWRQTLRGILERRGGELLAGMSSHLLRALRLLAPGLSHRLECEDGPSTDETQDSVWIQREALTEVLRIASAERPLFIVFDDLHHADADSVALLAFAAHQLPRAALLLVATRRADLAPRPATLRSVLREIGTDSLMLEELERPCVEAYLSAALRQPVEPALLARAMHSCGGNPYFLSELARLLRVSRENAAAMLESLPLSSGAREFVELRTEGHTPACREMLRCASVIGPCFSLGVLRAAIGIPLAALLDALHEARLAGLIVEESPGHYAFVHGIVQETLYAQLPTVTAMEIHAALATAMEGDPRPGRAAISSEITRHLVRSAPLRGPERAIHHLERAADEAMRLCAFQIAVRHCQQALSLLDLAQRPDPALRCELMLRLAEAQSAAEAPFETVHEGFVEASQLADSLQRPELGARALVGDVAHARRSGSLALLPGSTHALGLLDRYARQLGSLLACRELADPTPLRGRVLLSLAAVCYDRTELQRAREFVEQALVVADTTRDAELRARALIEHFKLQAETAHTNERVAQACEISALAQRLGSLDIEASADCAHVFLALSLGDRAALEAVSARIDRAAERTSLPRIRWMAYTCRSLRAHLDGRLDEAAREAFRASEANRARNVTRGFRESVIFFQAWLAGTCRGNTEHLRSLVEAAAAEDRANLHLRLILAHLHAQAGRFDEAATMRVAYVELLDRLPRHDGWFFAAYLVAELCALMNDARQAGPLLELLTPDAERGVAVFWCVAGLGALARPLGALGALLGRWSEVERLFGIAADYARRMESPMLRVLTQIDHATALSGQSRPVLRALRARLISEAQNTTRDLALPGLMARLDRRRRIDTRGAHPLRSVRMTDP